MMTKLEELIKELCPNGVEYKRLKDCSIMERGTAITQKQIQQGDIPVIAGGKKPAYYCEKFNREGETITVAGSGAYAGFLAYWNAPIFVSDAFSIKGTEGVMTKYLYYCLDCKQQEIYNTKKGGGVPHVHISSIESLQIPLPPLAVQCEIVRILDDFTLLSAELEDELAARRKQYEYYRDKLLSFDKLNGGGCEVRWLKIADICKGIVSGGTPLVSHQEYYDGGIPWLRTQEVDWKNVYATSMTISELGLENSSAKWIPNNCVIVAMYGATAGKVAINKIPLTTNQACCNLQVDEHKALYRYVYYWLCKEYLTLKGMGQGSQSNINAAMIKNYLIPIPPLEVQEKIVETLDKFDKLCNDLSEGLPAEIEARQKQYEYYRDKLLSFKECV